MVTWLLLNDSNTVEMMFTLNQKPDIWREKNYTQDCSDFKGSTVSTFM